MNIKTVKTILIGLCVAVAVFIFLVINPLLVEIKKDSQRFLVEKKQEKELAFRIDNLRDSKKDLAVFPRHLAISPVTYFDFFEFIKEEAETFRLSDKLDPRDLNKEETSSLFGFKLELSGSFDDLLMFMERMELTDRFLIHILSFDMNRTEKEGIIKISLLGEVYGRVF